MQRILVIGSSDAGISAALRAKEVDPHAGTIRCTTRQPINCESASPAIEAPIASWVPRSWGMCLVKCQNELM